LSFLLRGQQRLFAALSTTPAVLQSLIVNLNITAGAFARQESALSATVPLLRDGLRIGTPTLARLNNALPTLRPFARAARPGSTGQPFYKEAPRGLVGLAGESRIHDANTPVFHVQFGTGLANILLTDSGQKFYAQAPSRPEGARPMKPDHRPAFRPDVPCETQQVPNLS